MENHLGDILKVLICLFILSVGAVYSVGVSAVSVSNEARLRESADDGDKKAEKMLKMFKNRERFMFALNCGSVLSAVMFSAASCVFYAKYPARLIYLIHETESKTPSRIVSMIIVSLLAAFIYLCVSYFVPRMVTRAALERKEIRRFGIVFFFKAIVTPFAFLVRGVSKGLAVLNGASSALTSKVSEETILSMVDEAEEKDVIDEDQKEMINNIFEFDDIQASDVCTHRTDIEAVEINSGLEEIVKIAMETGYSRIPVYEDELDNIKGIIYIKDLLQFFGKIPKDTNLRKIMRKATYVPESKRCGDLFEEMTEKHIQMVIVADEYGGVAGLVTIEDLLESIVGNMQDEYDDEDEDIEQLDSHSYEIDGVTDIEEVSELLEIEFPDGDYDTIGGFLMSELQMIPHPDEHPEVECEGYRFTVRKMEDRRIAEIKVEKIEDNETEE